MNAINLKRFVDINIESHKYSTIVGTRDTVVLYTPEGSKGTTNLITSYTEAYEKYKNNATTLAYLKVFFDNSGAKVLVIEGYNYSDVTDDDINKLKDEYILVVIAIPESSQSAGYTAIKELATTRMSNTNIYGINEKIILSRTNTIDSDEISNFVVKYSSTLGAEMAVAAYLTKINVYKQNTIYDYMFTQEVITEESIDDTKYESIINNNMNVDVYLAGAVRNCGGNMKDGTDITNGFVKIILHQTLTERLIELLSTKIKGSTGISKIYNVVSQELNEYLNCGYLTTDKIWTDEDFNITYNGTNYTIIEKGTALPNGYIVKVLPYNSLSDADKAARKAPPIYLIIADQYGIRAITINGEVI